MKLLWYVFYHSFLTSIEQRKAVEKSYSGAVREISLVLFVPTMSLLIIIIDHSGIWPLILEWWPYDFGRVHSKNLFAPTGVLAVSSFVLIYWNVKKYFLFSRNPQTIIKTFRGKDSKNERKFGSWIGVLLFFYFCFCGVMSLYNGLLIYALLLGPILYGEYWIRKRFF